MVEAQKEIGWSSNHHDLQGRAANDFEEVEHYPPTAFGKFGFHHRLKGTFKTRYSVVDTGRMIKIISIINHENDDHHDDGDDGDDGDDEIIIII